MAQVWQAPGYAVGEPRDHASAIIATMNHVETDLQARAGHGLHQP
jgi:hypothetical protein